MASACDLKLARVQGSGKNDYRPLIGLRMANSPFELPHPRNDRNVRLGMLAMRKDNFIHFDCTYFRLLWVAFLILDYPCRISGVPLNLEHVDAESNMRK
jgi:hypothetical protein